MAQVRDGAERRGGSVARRRRGAGLRRRQQDDHAADVIAPSRSGRWHTGRGDRRRGHTRSRRHTRRRGRRHRRSGRRWRSQHRVHRGWRSHWRSGRHWRWCHWRSGRHWRWRCHWRCRRHRALLAHQYDRGAGGGGTWSAGIGRNIWLVNCDWYAPPPPTLTPPPSPEDTGVPSGSVAAVCPLFQPTTKAPGCEPYWNPRAFSAPSMFPVWNRSP